MLAIIHACVHTCVFETNNRVEFMNSYRVQELARLASSLRSNLTGQRQTHVMLHMNVMVLRYPMPSYAEEGGTELYA